MGNKKAKPSRSKKKPKISADQALTLDYVRAWAHPAASAPPPEPSLVDAGDDFLSARAARMAYGGSGSVLFELHSHSNHSDGFLSPSALVERTHRSGVKVLALTNDDTMAGIPEAVSAAHKFGIRIIPGVEISALYSPRSRMPTAGAGSSKSLPVFEGTSGRDNKYTTVQFTSEGMTLVYSNYNGDDYLISFGGYNGRYSNEVYALKLSSTSASQSNTKEEPSSDNTSRVLEPDVEISQDGKIREIGMDSADSKNRNNEAGEQILTALQAEKEQLEATRNREQLQTMQLKEEIAEAESRNAEGTRDALEKEVELLRRQKTASEQAALDPKQRQASGGICGWLVGAPPDESES